MYLLQHLPDFFLPLLKYYYVQYHFHCGFCVPNLLRLYARGLFFIMPSYLNDSLAGYKILPLISFSSLLWKYYFSVVCWNIWHQSDSSSLTEIFFHSSLTTIRIFSLVFLISTIAWSINVGPGWRCNKLCAPTPGPPAPLRLPLAALGTPDCCLTCQDTAHLPYQLSLSVLPYFHCSFGCRVLGLSFSPASSLPRAPRHHLMASFSPLPQLLPWTPGVHSSCPLDTSTRTASQTDQSSWRPACISSCLPSL